MAESPICFTITNFIPQNHSNFIVINLSFKNQNQVKKEKKKIGETKL